MGDMFSEELVFPCAYIYTNTYIAGEILGGPRLPSSRSCSIRPVALAILAATHLAGDRTPCPWAAGGSTKLGKNRRGIRGGVSSCAGRFLAVVMRVHACGALTIRGAAAAPVIVPQNVCFRTVVTMHAPFALIVFVVHAKNTDAR